MRVSNTFLGEPIPLKGSYDVAKKNIGLRIWCNAMCLCGFKVQKTHYFPHTVLFVAPLCSDFLKRIDFYKAHRSEKRCVL